MTIHRTDNRPGTWQRLVILGGGRVTSEYYLPALRRMDLIGVTTVVEPNIAQCNEIAASFPGVSISGMAYTDFLDQLPRPSGTAREAVVVALPNALHVDAVERAISRSHHVLCEKPLALARAACERLADAARHGGVQLKVAMTRRFLPTFMLARDIVRRNELGPVEAIAVRDCGPFLWTPRSFAFFAPESGGVLADMGVHYLDFLETLVGPMSPIAYQDDARGGSESSCTYRLQADAADVAVTLSRVAHSGHDITIRCERGTIRIDKANETELTVEPENGAKRRVCLAQPFDDPSWPSTYEGSFCQMIAELGRAVDGGASSLADASDAARTAGLIEWAYAKRAASTPAASAARGGRKVLVTGATGFIGGHLVERLAAAGDDIRVTVRSPKSCANVARFAVDMQPTVLTDIDSVGNAVRGCSVVYHLAYGNEGAGAPAITIEGTKNVVRAAIEAQVDCVVVLSTMYVFGFPDGGTPVDETFPYRPYGGEYASSKAEMERWCLTEAARSGRTRIVVLNPTCVFGPMGGAYTSLPVDLARQGQFCWIDGGHGTANYTYVENTVDAIVAAARCEPAHGERFIINDGHTTWRGLLEPLLAPLGVPVPSYTVDALAALPRFGGAFRMRDVIGAALAAPEVRSAVKRSAVLRRAFNLSKSLPLTVPAAAPLPALRQPSATPPVFPPDWLADLFPVASTTFTSAKAARVLGWTPRVALGEAHARTVRWLEQTGRLPARPVEPGAVELARQANVG